MLTAAVAALIAHPVFGDDFTDIKTKVTQQVQTSTAANGSPGDILIESAGSVVVTTAGPAVEIDSPNTVTNQGTISNIGTDDAIGVRLDATAAGNGPGSTATAFDSTGTVDLTGSGTGKTGILAGIANGDSTGIFNGGINLESGSKLTLTGDNATGIKIGDNTTLNGPITLAGEVTMSSGTGMTGIFIGGNADAPASMVGDLSIATGGSINLTGDGSVGIHIGPNSILDGNLDIGGGISVAPTDPKSTSGGNTVGILIDANDTANALAGNLTIESSQAISATGEGAQGIVLLGGVGGNFTNSGNIFALGTTSPSGTTSNPVGSSAVAIAASIGQGILNNGPQSPGDTTVAAQIQGNGVQPVLLISPTADGATATGDIQIGVYNPALPEGPYSFINRGQITTSIANVDQPEVTDVRIQGAGSFSTILVGGLFNSGTISASGKGDDKQQASLPVTSMWFGSGAVLPVLFNSNQNSASPGAITAEYQGSAIGGSAIAIRIDSGATLQRIVNQGTISADTIISDTTISGLTSRAIWDQSGTLTEVDNSGSIGAFATTLDDKSQVTVAIDMGVAQQDTSIDNSGTITGDIVTGVAADRILVHGTVDQAATITGNISFGGTSGTSSDDYLEVDDHATVAGAITDRAAGRLDVLVNSGGAVTITNDSTDLDQRFNVNQMTIGAGGTLGLTLSQTYNLSANPNAGGIVTATNLVTLNPQAILNLSFGGFLAGQAPGEPSQFILIDAPLNDLQLSLLNLQTQICPQVPFLFENGDQQCLTVDNSNTRSQLVLNLTPKSAQEIGLTGYALKMFPLANQALATDDELGAAVIQAGAPVNGIPLTQQEGQTLYQGIYSQFAPNVTGGSRALAVALTDQATGPVGARQRALRMYAGQPGDTTLWGQEFDINLNADAGTGSGTIGYRDSGFGFVLGADGGDPANGRYGGALSFYSGDIDEKQPRTSKTNSKWALLTGYTDWRGRGLFLDTQVSAGVGQLDGKRVLQVDDVTRVAEGKRATALGAIGATTGAILTSGSTIFTPLISVDGLLGREEGYTEHGGGQTGGGGDAFDLAVKPVYYDSARIFGGLNVRQDLNLGDFYLQPEARAGYRFDFLSNAEKVTAAFAGTPGTQFTISGPDPDRGNVVLGGSVAATTGAWSIGINYDYLRGNNGSVSQEGTLSLIGRI
ncbi:MAG TPA: autotransporter outer membrane beta-barrel domain-containing protein [Rhizomicrobium sp.]|nr:autotransporter outer membrane beta-barrel domain-containing protein [Rhizomicrobium sp.]